MSLSRGSEECAVVVEYSRVDWLEQKNTEKLFIVLREGGRGQRRSVSGQDAIVMPRRLSILIHRSAGAAQQHN